MKKKSELVWRDTWRRSSVNQIEINDDGSIPFGMLLGDVSLPEDYMKLSTQTGGITPLGEDNFCLAHYRDRVELIRLEYLRKLPSVITLAGDLYSGVYHGKPKMLPRHIPIGSGIGENFVMNVDADSSDFGKIFASILTQDPWGEGRNIRGLGWIANSFNEFMNNLNLEKILRSSNAYKNGASMDLDSFTDWYFDYVIKLDLPEFSEDLSESLCKTFTKNGFLYATHFGITRTDLQARFITLMWEESANYFMIPEFQKILNDPTQSQEQKVDAIESSFDEALETIRANDDPNYWYPELIKDNILGVPYEG